MLLLDKDRFCVCFLTLPPAPPSEAPPPVHVQLPAAPSYDSTTAADVFPSRAEYMAAGTDEQAAALAALALDDDEEAMPRPAGGVTGVAIHVQ